MLTQEPQRLTPSNTGPSPIIETTSSPATLTGGINSLPPWDPPPGIPIPPHPPEPNLLYHNTNPNPSSICNECRQYIGKIFAPGSEPRLPRHAGCFCHYVITFRPSNT